ncbi:MAG: hypothetical protein IIU74_04605, partial [Ruminiclostridium sp.]|nr:hypothetical protein [Ruminiclostridium sp.]
PVRARKHFSACKRGNCVPQVHNLYDAAGCNPLCRKRLCLFRQAEKGAFGKAPFITLEKEETHGFSG